MARRRDPEPTPPNGFVASAVRLPPVSRRAAGRTEGWMNAAWDNYNTVGELRFVANWVGNVMSRARLVAAHKDGQTLVPLFDGPAAEVMDAYYGGFQGQAQMLNLTGVHLTVAGECFHVALNGGEEDWAVLGTGKVSQSGTGPKAKVYADWGDGKKLLGPSDLAVRVWTPHPLDPYLADSPTRPNLSTLAEIRYLNEHVQAQLTSRLAGAGILMLPSEIQFPNTQAADPAASVADVFMSVLGEAMMTPIQDRSNASAIVPIVVTAPGESLEKVQHLTFWTELDDAAIAMREAAVKKLALGLDTPPEVLLGLADVNHWSGWLADEAAVKAHLEPRLSVVTHAITEAYLRPALEDSVPDPENFYVMADTSDIRLRPNRSREAIELYDRGELSGQAVRRETGFQPDDMPSDEEMRFWLLRKIATGSTSPEQTQAALDLLGASLGPVAGQEGPERSSRGDRRSLDQHPDVGPPDAGESQDREMWPSRQAALLAASEVLVHRALELAGNRLCNGRAKTTELGQCPAHERYMLEQGNPDKMLEGAWDYAVAVLDGYTPEPSEVVAVLDFYVRGLIASQRPYNRTTLTLLLRQWQHGGLSVPGDATV